mgnify:CR=1 FL=1
MTSKETLTKMFENSLNLARDEEAFPFTLYLKWNTENKPVKSMRNTTFKAVLDITGKYFVLTRHDSKISRRQFEDKWSVVIPQETMNLMVLRKVFRIRKGKELE